MFCVGSEEYTHVRIILVFKTADRLTGGFEDFFGIFSKQ
ncbi:hypothetical protein ASAP_1335 [Asaia bogorensis]|uniref:Uncharacterized protein n=1 Tax=Asaia bogorensis TaxID=91915 RepID=A0A060QEL7_9PROT|nr:hypothetical protein ASAP_1335 [Asaia bogorensis]